MCHGGLFSQNHFKALICINILVYSSTSSQGVYIYVYNIYLKHMKKIIYIYIYTLFCSSKIWQNVIDLFFLYENSKLNYIYLFECVCVYSIYLNHDEYIYILFCSNVIHDKYKTALCLKMMCNYVHTYMYTVKPKNIQTPDLLYHWYYFTSEWRTLYFIYVSEDSKIK